jgi:putative phosphoesterase
MKILFISDIHGMPGTLKKALEHADKLQADQLVILGDILYHGPRNGVPDLYNPPEVVELLNARKNQILAVRGNCDAEVDQMMLHFPVMADFSEVLTDTARFFLTHGHIWNAEHLPPLPQGSILVHGHTHLPVLEKLENGITIFNPGSISLPKGGNPPTFGWFDGKELSLRLLSTGEIFS